MQKQSSQQPIPQVQKKVEQVGVQTKVKKQKPKKQKKQQVVVAKKDQQPTPQLFALIDMRVGTIKQCWKHPQSEKLFCQKIQVLGQVREIASGLQQFVKIEEMTGNCLVMVNLKPRPLAGFMSNGMVVCASNHQHTQVEVLRPKGEIDQRMVLEGFQNLFGKEPVALINPKKKILQRCLPLFKTDQQGFVTWNGIKVKLGGQYIQATLKNGGVS